MSNVTRASNSTGKLNIVPNDWKEIGEYCSKESLKYLEDSLKRLEKGQDPSPAFPLYGTRDHNKLFARIIAILEQLKLPDWLIEYEKSRLSKVGRQGGVPAWSKLEENFKLYQTALKPVSYVDPDIMKEMLLEYGKLNCRLAGIEETLQHLIRSDKIETRAAGWNEFQLKKTDKKAQTEAVRMAKSGLWKEGYGYTFARYNKLKYRIFMPMPFSSMLKQAQFYVSFLEQIQKDLLLRGMRSLYTAWADKIGFEKCFQIAEDLLNQYDDIDQYDVWYYQNDFEKMDTRTGSEQYKSFVVPTMSAAHHNKSQDLVDTMMFTTTAPIISPSGTMKGDHGTASGAEVTNGGESICNDYFQRRFIKLLRKELDCKVALRLLNGDDSTFVILTPKGKYSKEIVEEAIKKAALQVCSETGFDIQVTKFKISDKYGLYCQNIYYYDRKSRKLIWFYPMVLAFNSIVHPERQYTPAQWDKDYRDLDVITKADNMSRHPAYTQGVDLLMAGMKYPLLGRNESETKRILSKYDEYRRLQSLGERYNRQDYDISKSPTVNYVLSKR